jgi:hypothetical protein
MDAAKLVVARLSAAFALLPLTLVTLAGCSRKDPVTVTPSYHIGTPTNSASANSWELGQPGNTIQPGRYSGKTVTLPDIPSQSGFEPGDPLAVAVRDAFSRDTTLSARFITVSAKRGSVILEGSVTTSAQRTLAAQIAGSVPGVKAVQSKIVVIPAG